MTFGTLAVISLIAILGPLLALPRWNLPVVLGELIAGIALGPGHSALVLVRSAPAFDLVAQDEVGAGVAGVGGGEVFTQFGEGGGGPPGW